MTITRLLDELAAHWQVRAAEHAAFAHWVQGKAIRQKALFEAGLANDYVLRCNQWRGEMHDAYLCAATARKILGID